MNAPCVVTVLDTGINTEDTNRESYLPEISFHSETEIPAALKAHGTDICETILKIAPEAVLLPVQITNQFGQLSTSLLEKALDWILQHHHTIGIRIVCAAFADYTHQTSDTAFSDSLVKSKIALLKEQGVIVVAAAGNWQKAFKSKALQGMAWPAIIREIISVGALDANGKIASYSQRLNKAMNTGCATTVFAMPDAPGDTSGATAVVAGMLAKTLISNPLFTTSELIRRFESDFQTVEDEEGNLWPVLRC